jgi:DUF4097 and DUF4098 domain-containing protein YvlB
MRTTELLLFVVFLAVSIAAPARADVSDRIARVIPILPGTPVSVQITIGHLLVSGWDRNDVSVEIVRRAPDPQQLALIPAHVEQGADGVVVRAVQADGGHDARLRTDVVLRVPSIAQLRDVAVFEGRIELEDLRGACAARLERGEITGMRLSGAVRLETAIGNIRLAAVTLSPRGMMRLRTFNGDVALELTSTPAHARILALSLGGSITSDIPLALKQRWGPRFGEATLGNGEPVISIDVVNGNVAITVARARQ